MDTPEETKVVEPVIHFDGCAKAKRGCQEAAFLLGALSASVALDLKTKRAIGKWLREYGRGQ